MEALVSIVLAVKDEGKTIRGCIDSLLALSYSNYEVIVVDNGSSDDTLDIIKSYGDKVSLLTNSTPGPSACRNMAVAHARGEYIAFTDGDCIVEQDWLDELMKGFEEGENVVSVGGDQLSPADETEWGKRAQLFLKAFGFLGDYIKENKDEIIETEHNPSCNVIYKCEVFDEVGLFREDFWPGEDVEYDYRIKKKGYKILYNPKAVVYHYRPSNFEGFKNMMLRYGTTQALLIHTHGMFRRLHYIPFLTLFVLSIYLLILILDLTLGSFIFWTVLLLLFIYYLKVTENIQESLIMVYVSCLAFIKWHIGFFKSLFRVLRGRKCG